MAPEVTATIQQRNHRAVEFGKLPVSEGRIIAQAPLPARVVIKPVVAFAGKINPFQLTEFVVHEIQITRAGRGNRGEA